MLNIIVPMAGSGSRFAQAGYALPKPLIPVHGVPMIRLVIANLTPRRPHRFIFICQRAHIAQYDLDRTLCAWSPGAAVVAIDGLTQGSACSVLAARDLIDSDAPLMIANSDQFVDSSIDDYLADQDARDLDGLIMTMPADDPKWSFAATDQAGLVTRVAEKQVISQDATAGIYNVRRGSAFVRGADAMIAADLRVNNEFYVAPVYNQLIAAGARIGIFDVGSAMHGIGVPADLAAFAALPVSRQITAGLR